MQELNEYDGKKKAFFYSKGVTFFTKKTERNPVFHPD